MCNKQCSFWIVLIHQVMVVIESVLEMLTVKRLCNDFPDLEVSSGIFVEDPRYSVQEIYNKLT